MADWNLDLIGEKLIAASFDYERWTEVLNCIAEQTDARGAIILPVSGKHFPNVPFGDQLARATEVYFRDDWYARDIRYHTSIPKWIRKGVLDDLDCIALDDMPKSPYYQEFLAPFGLRWFAGVKMQAGNDLWCVSINRGLNQHPFSPDEKQKLARLSGQLSTAAAFAQAIGFSAATAALDAFDISQTAAVLVDRKAEVTRANRAAERLLKGEVQIVGRRISCSNADAVAALDRALHRLLWNPSGASLMPPIALPRNAQSPVLAYPLKLPSLATSVMAEAQAAIILIEPNADRVPPEMTLQRAFRLTAAEARFASSLAAGESLASVCAALDISKETGRSHLKAAFEKTGTHRQGELIRMIVRLL